MDSFTDTLPYLIVLSSLFLLCIILYILGLRNNKIKSLNNENENLNDQIRKYKNDIAQLNKQITSGNTMYSQLYNQNAVHGVQINNLEEEISTLNDKNTSLQNEIRSLQTQIRSYEKDYLRLQGQVKTLTQQKDKLQKAYNHAVFETQNNANKDLISEINGYKNDIAQLNKQINSGNKKYSQLYNQNAVHVVQINNLREEISALNDKNTSLKNEIRSQQTQIRSYEKDYLRLQGQVKTLTQQKDKLQKAYNQAVAAKEALEKKLEEWKLETENEGNYNKKHAHPRDKNLTFDENEHKYFVGNKELKSVTSLVEEYFPPFDAERLAYLVGKKTGRNPQELIAEWDRKGEEARTLGTMMHENIEKFYLGEAYENNDIFGQFLDFTKNTHLVPYRTEWPIYDEEAGIAGTLDFLDYQNGEYIIYDWKRSKKVVSPKIGKPITKSKNKTKGLQPITDIEDAPYWHYALQTSLYRYILKRDYGIEVAKSRLVVMHPELKQVFITDVPYMEKEVIAILEDQKRRR